MSIPSTLNWGIFLLNQRLQNDEVLAVAYQFTVGGQVYQVGEFANDGVNATDVNINVSNGNQIVNNQSLVLKMLKSPVTNVDQPYLGFDDEKYLQYRCLSTFARRF